MAEKKKKEKRIRSMKFSTRIILSFIAITLIPILLTIGAYLFLSNYRLDDYGIEGVSDEGIYRHAHSILNLLNSRPVRPAPSCARWEEYWLSHLWSMYAAIQVSTVWRSHTARTVICQPQWVWLLSKVCSRVTLREA